MDSDRAIMFGGTTSLGRSNELFVLDLKLKSWCKILEESISIPEPRSVFSFTKFSSHQAFLYGGMGNLCTPFNDAWILNLFEFSWTEVPLSYDHGQIRCYHGSICTSDSEVIIHSGLTQEYYINRIQLDHHPQKTLLRFPFGVPRLFTIATNAIMKANLICDDLPSQLKTMIQKRRLEGEIDYGDGDHFDQEHFDRTTIHAGIWGLSRREFGLPDLCVWTNGPICSIETCEQSLRVDLLSYTQKIARVHWVNPRLLKCVSSLMIDEMTSFLIEEWLVTAVLASSRRFLRLAMSSSLR